MAPASATIARRELALRIRERRLELGKDVKDVARELGFSRNYWSTVENDRTVLSESKLEALARYFELGEHETEELLALREATKKRGWWTRLPPPSDEQLMRLYGLEYGARRVRAYEGTMVTGLLQTEDYARALIASDPAVSPVVVEQNVRTRLKRQERVGADDPLHVSTILSEGALMQQIGGAEVLRGQLSHLAKLIRANPESIDVRILPFTAPVGYVIGAGTTYLLDFDSAYLPTIAYLESVMRTSRFVEDPAVVNHLSLRFDESLEFTLSREASLDMIELRVESLADY